MCLVVNLHVLINQAGIAQFDKGNDYADRKRPKNLWHCYGQFFFTHASFHPVQHQQKKKADKL